MTRPLDDVDRDILRELQRDARSATAQEMAETAGVSQTTVRNRIDRLEAAGVIEGYVPVIGYEAAGLALQTLLICTSPSARRGVRPGELIELDGMVDVRETVADRSTVYATMVATDASEIERRVEDVHGADLTVERADIVSASHWRPCNHPVLVGTDEAD